MRCVLCNGTVSTKQGHIAFESKIVGKVIVPNIEFEECKSCKDINIHIDEYDKITNFIEDKERFYINQLPIGDFISAQEAAQLLGMTKQAFSKNSRIKRGFIISTMIDNRRYFHKGSVVKFAHNKKDGRFLILKDKSIEEWFTLIKERDVSKTIKHIFPPTERHKVEDIPHHGLSYLKKHQLGAEYYKENTMKTVEHGELYETTI